MNQFLAQVFRGNSGIGDFPKRNDRVLVVIAVNRELLPGRNHTGAMCRQQHQVEPVVDLINAIFHGDARHRLSLRYLGPNMSVLGASYSGGGRFARLNL